MSRRVYEVHYFGTQNVNHLSSNSVLEWTAREISSKAKARRITVTIHNSYINLLSDNGLIAAIPFSFHSPYSCGATSPDPSSHALLYLTELCSLAQGTQQLKCHVIQLDSMKKAGQLRDDITLLQGGALTAAQRDLEHQVSMREQLVTVKHQLSVPGQVSDRPTKLFKLKRSRSDERLYSSQRLEVLTDKTRRSSDDQRPAGASGAAGAARPSGALKQAEKCRRRRKSTPIKCGEIHNVEYIGSLPSEGSQLPDIDGTVREILRNREMEDSEVGMSVRGLLHIGHNEIQLLNTDHVTLIRAWPIRVIKACSQGENSEYFGWSCREVFGAEGRESCVHVLKADQPDDGVTILHTLHKACLSAYNQLKASTPHKDICKDCPIAIFNSICDKLIGLDEEDVSQELVKVMDGLSESDILEVFQMFKTEDKDVNIQNILLIGCLRTIYERQQQNHSHTCAVNSNQKGGVERRARARTTLSQTDAADRQPLTTAQDKRRARRQKSTRKAIYDSVHMANTRERLVCQLKTKGAGPPLTEPTETAAVFDVVTVRDQEQLKHWESLLKRRASVDDQYRGEVEAAVFAGVPDTVRGQVWELLCTLRECEKVAAPPLLEYKQLLKTSSSFHNAISLDIGRTFPGHHYYRDPSGEGQARLSNLLLAYSVHDIEVGYCQGMSFLAGLLLVHLPEEASFSLFTSLLSKYQMRDNYKPGMDGIKLRLYQLSRLVHDRYFNIHEHLNTHEVTPSLYAVSWLMTAFATQLPFSLASRIMDFVFLQGMDAVFKVILYIIGTSEKEILDLKCFDSLISYMKEVVPDKITASFEYHVKDIFGTSLSTDLRDLQIEYKVLHEDIANANKTEYLETKYDLLKLQNKCHANQITQLNRELEKSRAEKRRLIQEIEKRKQDEIKDRSLLSTEVDKLREELDMARWENEVLRGKVAEMEQGNSGLTENGTLLSEALTDLEKDSLLNLETLISNQLKKG